MKKAHRQRIETFIHSALIYLEMKDWRIVLTDEPADDDHDAEVYCVEGQKLAMVRVSPEFMTLPQHRRKRVLVHELVHCLVRDPEKYVQSTLPGMLGGPAFGAFYEPYRLATEVMVDTLSYALSDLLPLEV